MRRIAIGVFFTLHSTRGGMRSGETIIYPSEAYKSKRRQSRDRG
jgi:hypothetical protein